MRVGALEIASVPVLQALLVRGDLVAEGEQAADPGGDAAAT